MITLLFLCRTCCFPSLFVGFLSSSSRQESQGLKIVQQLAVSTSEIHPAVGVAGTS